MPTPFLFKGVTHFVKRVINRMPRICITVKPKTKYTFQVVIGTAQNNWTQYSESRKPRINAVCWSDIELTNSIPYIALKGARLGVHCVSFGGKPPSDIKSITVTSYEHDGVSNHQQFHCLFNRLSRCPPKKISKLIVTGPWEENLPVTDGFPSQRAST